MKIEDCHVTRHNPLNEFHLISTSLFNWRNVDEYMDCKIPLSFSRILKDKIIVYENK